MQSTGQLYGSKIDCQLGLLDPFGLAREGLFEQAKSTLTNLAWRRGGVHNEFTISVSSTSTICQDETLELFFFAQQKPGAFF